MAIPDATYQAAANAVALLGNWLSLHTGSGGGTTGANEATGGNYGRVQTPKWTASGTGTDTSSAETINCAAASYIEGGIFSTETGDTLSPPTGLAVTQGTTGALPHGTYYYVCTATNWQGETIASNEVSLDITSGSTPSAELSCTAVTSAAGYNWYRGTAEGAEDVLLASTTSPSFTDVYGTTITQSPPIDNTASTFVGSSPFTGGEIEVSGDGATITVTAEIQA